MSPLFSVELAIKHAGLAESVVFMLSIINLRTGLLIKEDIFFVNIFMARSFFVLTEWAISRVTLE